MCLKCKHRVYYDPTANALYYMGDNCDKIPLPAGALAGGVPIGGGGSPSLPPDDQLPTDPTSTIACQKATGVWQVIEDFADALIASFEGLSLTPLNSTRKFFTDYGSNLKAQNWRVLEFISNHFTDDPDIGEAWEEHKETTKADFICAAQDAFSKFPLLSDADYEWLFAYDFDSPSALLDDFLTDVLEVPENAAWSESSTYHVFAQVGTCSCTGDEPIPPPQTEPLEGEFGLFAGEVVGNITTSMTPAGSRADDNPRGTKISEIRYDLPAYDADTEQWADLFVMWEASEPITQVMLDMLWKYTGTDSDSSHVVAYFYEFYYAASDGVNWGKMAGNVGEASENDSSAPAKFFGAVNSQRLPWDDSLQSWNAGFIGFHLRFALDSDNTPVAIPSGEFTIVNFKAKAVTGGNYRATFVPMQFVPKAL